MLALEQLKSKVRNFSISVNEVLSQNLYDEQLVKDLQEAVSADIFNVTYIID